MTVRSAARYRARIASSAEDLRAAQALRQLAFRGQGEGLDSDRFDAACRHVLVEDVRDGTLVCCYRLLSLRDGTGIGASYSAQHYGLAALRCFAAPMAEIGRFCVRPGASDPDILRIAWSELARVVDADGIALLFGCSSFRGVEPAAYRDTFALLNARHLAPPRWAPAVKAPAVVRFAQVAPSRPPDRRRALRGLPPLLRSYLSLGGWVSDHAVIDRDLDTLHVFTGVEIGAIPPDRARALRMPAR